MTLARRIERSALRGLMRLPAAWVQRVAGASIEIDGNRLDPHLQLYLRGARLAGQAELTTRSPEASRQQLEESVARVAGPQQHVGSVHDRLAGELPIRVYRPASPATPSGAAAVVFFHGGGGVAGSLDSHDEPCRLLCSQLGAVVISVDYRRAPEHRFPVADDDALRAFRWVHANAGTLGVDAARIAVCGDSFGGHLAANIALAATRAEVPSCKAALLFYPWLDVRLSSPSITRFGEGFLLTHPTMDWYRQQYMPDPDTHDDDRASPMRAPDLAGLPPMVIMTAGFDPLRDEGRTFADRLAEAGVDVEYRCAGSMIHGFINFSVSMPVAARFFREAVDLLRPRL